MINYPLERARLTMIRAKQKLDREMKLSKEATCEEFLEQLKYEYDMAALDYQEKDHELHDA